MAKWTWYACDLTTGRLITELPVRTTGLTAGLNMIGAAQFTMPTKDPTTPADWEIATIPRRTVLVGEVNGNVMWAGIIWFRNRNAGDEISLQCSTIESYWSRRYVDSKMGPYTNVEQAQIAINLLHHGQSVKGIGSDTPYGVVYHVFTTGVTRDRTEYNRYADQKLYDMIDNLAQLDDGFEWQVRVVWAAGATPKRLSYEVWLNTTLGNVTATPTIAFEFPGNVVDWSLDEDFTEDAYANEVVVGGEGEENARVMSTVAVARDQDSIDHGNPMIEYRLQTQLTTQSGVDAAAIGTLATMRDGAQVLTLTVQAEDLLGAGNLQLGDTVKVVLQGGGMPDKYEAIWRMVAWSLDPEANTITPTLNPY